MNALERLELECNCHSTDDYDFTKDITDSPAVKNFIKRDTFNPHPARPNEYKGEHYHVERKGKSVAAYQHERTAQFYSMPTDSIRYCPYWCSDINTETI